MYSLTIFNWTFIQSKKYFFRMQFIQLYFIINWIEWIFQRAPNRSQYESCSKCRSEYHLFTFNASTLWTVASAYGTMVWSHNWIITGCNCVQVSTGYTEETWKISNMKRKKRKHEGEKIHMFATTSNMKR